MFTSIRELNLGNALDGIEPKLDSRGNLPTRGYLLNWAKLPIHSLEKIAKLNAIIGGDHQGSDVDPAYKPLFKHFDSDSGHSTQRAEAGRFILLISEGCRFILRMKKMLQDDGPKLLHDLTRTVDTHLKDKLNPQHHLHNQVQRCWELLQTKTFQNLLDIEEYHEFTKKLISERQKHLAMLMVLLGKSSKDEKSGIQEMQLQLELQAHWSGMDNRGELRALKSHGGFKEHLSSFQETLLNRLQGMSLFQDRVEDEMKQGGFLNSKLPDLLEGIHDLLAECTELKSTLPDPLADRVKKEQMVVKRLINQVNNYQRDQQEDFKGWPTIALARYRYLEMECIRTFFLFKEKEIQNMGRCIPHIFKAIQRDLEGVQLEESHILKRKLEELITTTGRILKKSKLP